MKILRLQYESLKLSSEVESGASCGGIAYNSSIKEAEGGELKVKTSLSYCGTLSRWKKKSLEISFPKEAHH